jgi:hypothetical protein
VLKPQGRQSKRTASGALLLTAVVCAVALGWAPAAVADVTSSSNWAGYAVHRPRVFFHRVSAVWRQPAVTCTHGRDSYSAFWVGLGGYKRTARALEQIGTEIDCRPSGRVVSSAWYELIPHPTTPIELTVEPGDVIAASVTVRGHLVTVQLGDLTRRRAFKRTVHASRVDVSSAEWIVEAPSACLAPDLCETLPLANFGVTTFEDAQAQLMRGHFGSISDPAWRTTMIKLRPGARQFVGYGSAGDVGAATPSPLLPGGSSFDISYSHLAAKSDHSSARLPFAYLAHRVR